MTEASRTYIAIDLKSFFASVECVERGLDPLTANLVVADADRTDKTICLAVSPSLKAYGIGGRARLFEVNQRVAELARQGTKVEFIIAPPRMAYYIDYSTRIYEVYLKYIAPEDIHVYSIDEVFIDATEYLKLYKTTAHDLAMKMIRDVLRTTGITATAGIGTNMYLCKVAMDIVAKHIPADKDGVRIAELDEMSYRRLLWDHQPLTDFWRTGKGLQKTLNRYGLYTMGDIARASLKSEDFFFKTFGVNAELIIDHAWGWEPCTIDYIKAYRPQTSSLSNGQVLTRPYPFDQALVVAQEMAENAALRLLRKHLLSDQIVITVYYDAESLTEGYSGEVKLDYYGRAVPKYAQGTSNLKEPTCSMSIIREAVTDAFKRVVDPSLLVRRLNISTNHIIHEDDLAGAARMPEKTVQLDLFSDFEAEQEQKKASDKNLEKERKLMETMLTLKEKFGKNSILKGLDFEEGATQMERNRQIGGHKA